jgi:hypothetical protein
MVKLVDLAKIRETNNAKENFSSMKPLIEVHLRVKLAKLVTRLL